MPKELNESLLKEAMRQMGRKGGQAKTKKKRDAAKRNGFQPGVKAKKKKKK